MKALGIVLMIAGLIALAYGGFTYTTHKREVDMGPLHVERSQRHQIPLPPLLGLGGIVIGGVLLFAGSRR